MKHDTDKNERQESSILNLQTLNSPSSSAVKTLQEVAQKYLEPTEPSQSSQYSLNREMSVASVSNIGVNRNTSSAMSLNRDNTFYERPQTGLSDRRNFEKEKTKEININDK
jgi:hypothetical protein